MYTWQAAQYLAVLGNEVRLGVLLTLSNVGPKGIALTALSERTAMDGGELERHLIELTEARLVRHDRASGRYASASDLVEQLVEFLGQRLLAKPNGKAQVAEASAAVAAAPRSLRRMLAGDGQELPQPRLPALVPLVAGLGISAGNVETTAPQRSVLMATPAAAMPVDVSRELPPMRSAAAGETRSALSTPSKRKRKKLKKRNQLQVMVQPTAAVVSLPAPVALSEPSSVQPIDRSWRELVGHELPTGHIASAQDVADLLRRTEPVSTVGPVDVAADASFELPEAVSVAADPPGVDRSATISEPQVDLASTPQNDRPSHTDKPVAAEAAEPPAKASPSIRVIVDRANESLSLWLESDQLPALVGTRSDSADVPAAAPPVARSKARPRRLADALANITTEGLRDSA